MVPLPFLEGAMYVPLPPSHKGRNAHLGEATRQECVGERRPPVVFAAAEHVERGCFRNLQHARMAHEALEYTEQLEVNNELFRVEADRTPSV